MIFISTSLKEENKLVFDKSFSTHQDIDLYFFILSKSNTNIKYSDNEIIVYGNRITKKKANYSIILYINTEGREYMMLPSGEHFMYIFAENGVYCTRKNCKNNILYSQLYHIINLNINLYNYTRSTGNLTTLPNIFGKYLEIFDNNSDTVIIEYKENKIIKTLRMEFKDNNIVIDGAQKVKITKEEYNALAYYLKAIADRDDFIQKLRWTLEYASAQSIYADVDNLDGNVMMLMLDEIPVDNNDLSWRNGTDPEKFESKDLFKLNMYKSEFLHAQFISTVLSEMIGFDISQYTDVLLLNHNYGLIKVGPRIVNLGGGHFISCMSNSDSFITSESRNLLNYLKGFSDLLNYSSLSTRSDKLGGTSNNNCLIYAFTTFLCFFISQHGVCSLRSFDGKINKTLSVISKLKTKDDLNTFINSNEFVNIYKFLYELLIGRLCDYYKIIDAEFDIANFNSYLKFKSSPFNICGTFKNSDDVPLQNLPNETKIKLKLYEYVNSLQFCISEYDGFNIDFKDFSLFSTDDHINENKHIRKFLNKSNEFKKLIDDSGFFVGKIDENTKTVDAIRIVNDFLKINNKIPNIDVLCKEFSSDGLRRLIVDGFYMKVFIANIHGKGDVKNNDKSGDNHGKNNPKPGDDHGKGGVKDNKNPGDNLGKDVGSNDKSHEIIHVTEPSRLLIHLKKYWWAYALGILIVGVIIVISSHKESDVSVNNENQTLKIEDE